MGLKCRDACGDPGVNSSSSATVDVLSLVAPSQGMVDANDAAGLEQALGSRLAFGTAGLRGEVRPLQSCSNLLPLIIDHGDTIRHARRDSADH